jgi:SET domain-containing protein
MKDLRYITDAKGKHVAAVVPIDAWKKLNDKYNDLRKKRTEADTEDVDPPKIKKRKKPLFVVKESGIHGRGVFATKDIKKGKPVIEYQGEHISQEIANERFEEKDDVHHHTVLFTIDDDTVIDASSKGNEARFINHSCDPNCEAIQYGRRIFIESLRPIKKGEELTYDYHLQVDKPHTKKKLQQYVCHCGAKNCRGTQVDLDS